MFTFLRSRLRFAGRIGWVDGRRGYPGEEQYVELELQRPGTPVDELHEPAEQQWPEHAAAVRGRAAGQRP